MNRYRYSMLVGVSALVIGMPAYAQNDSATEVAAAPILDADIVVTARRREERLLDVPQTVNVVTGAQVEKLNLRNFTDIQSLVPGLQMQSTSAFSNSATVRGVAFSPEASGNNPSVEFYMNDAPVSSAFLFQSTFDFGQFELQRGPQGTLRGRAAPSGSITVTAKRPDLSEIGGVLNGTVANRNARQFNGAINIPILKDMLAVRLAGVVDNGRGTHTESIREAYSPALIEGPFRRTKAVRGTVRFEPTDWAAFNFLYQNLHSEDHNFNASVSNSLIDSSAAVPRPSIVSGIDYTPIIRPFDRKSIDETGSYNRQDQDLYILNADIRVAGQKISYVGSYNKQDNGIVASQDQSDLLNPVRIPFAQRVPGDVAGFAPVCQNEAREQGVVMTTGSNSQCTHSSSTRWSHELRVSSEERIAGIFDYVVGAFYDRNKPRSSITAETPLIGLTSGAFTGAVNFNRSSIIRIGSSTEKSAFGNVTAHLLNDKLELSGGLRYIDYKSSSLPTYQNSTAASAVPCPGLTGVTCSASGSAINQKTNATIYTASVKYKVTDDIMVYALTGSSFRPGPRVVGNFSAAISPREEQFLNLPDENSKSYEIGIKAAFAGGRGTFNLSGYRQDFKNYPYRGALVQYVTYQNVNGTITPSVGTFNFVSAVPVQVYGVEAEASYQLMRGWSLGVNAAFADGRIQNGTIACTDLNGDGRPDINAPNASLPQLQGAVGLGQNLSQCSGINRRSSQNPKFSANIQSEYGFELNPDADLFVRGLYTFYGKTQNDPDNVFDDVSAYGLFNLYAGLRGHNGNWEISAFAKNLLQERQILTVEATARGTTYRNQVGAVQATPFVSQYRQLTVTAPREFGITARISFGSR